MKINRISLYAAALGVAVFQLACGPCAHAAGQNKYAAQKLLLSGPWRISGDGMSSDIIFLQNGTFTTDDLLDLPGRWSFGEGGVTLFFPDGHSDTLNLPIDPKGTTGSDNGRPIAAVMVDALGAAPAPNIAASPVTPVPETTPVPPRRVRRPPPPTPTPEPPAPVATPLPADPTAALLVSGPWKLSTNNGSDIRIFKADGTFTTLDKPAENGRWSATKDSVILSFPSGHAVALTLPLNPAGTAGMADDGSLITAVLLNTTAAATTPKPSATVSIPPPTGDGGEHYFGTKLPPAQ